MNNKVLLLCDSYREEGLIFPKETDGECGFPGFFVIEENQGKLNEQYTIDAIQSSKRVTLALNKRDRNVFVTKSNVGIFYFMAHRINDTYVGKINCLQNHNPFWVLEPVNTKQLEDVCQKHDFFFVGSMQV